MRASREAGVRVAGWDREPHVVVKTDAELTRSGTRRSVKCGPRRVRRLGHSCALVIELNLKCNIINLPSVATTYHDFKKIVHLAPPTERIETYMART